MAGTAACENANRPSFTEADYQARVNEGKTLNELQHLFWADFGPSHVATVRDSERVAANFPKVDIDLVSPAFLRPETVPPEFFTGKGAPTDQATLNQFAQQIGARHSWMTVHTPEFLSDDGYSFMYLTLSMTAASCRDPKLRIWMQSGVHGNEPAGDQAVLALLGKMDRDPTWTREQLQNIDILVLPCYNPDGVAEFNRPCSNGIDLNRDHVRLQIPQSGQIRKIFCDFAPHIAIDMHEFSAKGRMGNFIHGSDVMFSAAKNLNIHREIRELAEKLLVPEIGLSLENAGFRWEPYVPGHAVSMPFREAGSDGKIGRNALGLTQCISFLCETRGIGIADQHFHRRTAAGFTFLEGLLHSINKHCDLIHNVIKGSIQQFILGNEDIVVKDKACMIDRTFTMIDATTGSLVQLPVQFNSTTPTSPTLVRSRPEAYAIPSNMFAVAGHLYISGLKMQKLEHDWCGEVEILTMDSAIMSRTYFEATVPVTVKTSATRHERTLPGGTFVVSTRQRNAGLAFIALEPENIDSYVSTNIIPVVAAQEYAVFRIMISIPSELVSDWSP